MSAEAFIVEHKTCNVKQFDYHELISFSRDEVRIVRVEPITRTTRVFRYQSLLRKIAFFLVREGFCTVWRKYISARFAKRVFAQAAFMIVEHVPTKTFWWGYQHSKRQPVFYFLPTAWSTSLPPHVFPSLVPEIDPFLGYWPAPERDCTPPLRTGFKPIRFIGQSRNSSNQDELILVGCGDYIRTVVLPAFKHLYPKAAVDFNYEVLISRYFSNFEIRTNDFEDVLNLHDNCPHRKVAVIASYHSYHAAQAVSLLKLQNFKVIIEKPPCVTLQDLRLLAAHYDAQRVFVGYNRRYIPWNRIVRELLLERSGPVVANVIVTETQITVGHWYFAPTQGTRICGNLCHWVDLAVFLLGCRPKSVSIARNSIKGLEYSSFSLVFEDGSVFNFTANDLGDGTRGVQEYIRIRNEEFDIQIDDYLSMRIWNKGRVRHYWAIRRDKGHRRMYEDFAGRIASSMPSPYTRDDLMFSTLAYLSMVDLYCSGADSIELDFGKLGTAVG